MYLTAFDLHDVKRMYKSMHSNAAATGDARPHSQAMQGRSSHQQAQQK